MSGGRPSICGALATTAVACVFALPVGIIAAVLLGILLSACAGPDGETLLRDFVPEDATPAAIATVLDGAKRSGLRTAEGHARFGHSCLVLAEALQGQKPARAAQLVLEALAAHERALAKTFLRLSLAEAIAIHRLCDEEHFVHELMGSYFGTPLVGNDGAVSPADHGFFLDAQDAWEGRFSAEFHDVVAAARQTQRHERAAAPTVRRDEEERKREGKSTQ